MWDLGWRGASCAAAVAAVAVLLGTTDPEGVVQGQQGVVLGVLPRWGGALAPVAGLALLTAGLLPPVGCAGEAGGRARLLLAAAGACARLAWALVAASVLLGGWQPLPCVTPETLGIRLPAPVASAVLGAKALCLCAVSARIRAVLPGPDPERLRILVVTRLAPAALVQIVVAGLCAAGAGDPSR